MDTATPEPERDVDGAAIEQEIGDAIAAVLNKHQGSMPLKWVALVDVMEGNGKRTMWTLQADGQAPWDLIGMLSYGLQMSQAIAVSAELDVDDEG